MGTKKLVGTAAEVFAPSPTQALRYFRFLFFLLSGGGGSIPTFPPSLGARCSSASFTKSFLNPPQPLSFTA